MLNWKDLMVEDNAVPMPPPVGGNHYAILFSNSPHYLSNVQSSIPSKFAKLFMTLVWYLKYSLYAILLMTDMFLRPNGYLPLYHGPIFKIWQRFKTMQQLNHINTTMLIMTTMKIKLIKEPMMTKKISYIMFFVSSIVTTK